MKIIGEILSLISSSTEVYERGIKTYNKSIKVGMIRYCIQALAYICLGGINGMIITVMALFRHLLMYHKKFSGWIVWLWISISAVINLWFVSAVTDLFPFAATLQFTFMVRKQNALWLKYAQIVNTLIWSIYHIAHRTYIYLLSDVILIIVGIIRVKRGVED